MPSTISTASNACNAVCVKTEDVVAIHSRDVVPGNKQKD